MTGQCSKIKKYCYKILLIVSIYVSDYAFALQYNGSLSKGPYVSRLITPTIHTVGDHCFSFDYTTINGVKAYLSLDNGTYMTVFNDSYTEMSFVDWKRAYVTLHIDSPGAHLVIAGTKPTEPTEQYILVVDNICVDLKACTNLHKAGKV